MARKSYPQGYWPLVFDQATTLLNSGVAKSGEAAYWLARRMVDQNLGLKASATLEAKGQLLFFENLALAS